MSDWRPKTKIPARFRGVPFFVENVERTGGRRTIQHVYPLRDEPYSEDMGRKARTFPIEGFVVGVEYMADRDALLDALETAGTGELVHPHYGTLRVAVANFRVRESSDRGGMAQFSIEFDQTPDKPAQPSAVPDAAGKLKASSLAAKTAAASQFLATYSPGTLLASVSGSLRSGSLAMSNLLGTVTMETQQLTTLKRQVSAFSANATALANVPADLLAGQLGIFEALADGLVAASGTADAVSPVLAVLALYGFDPGNRPPATTATRILERANFDAVLRLNQRLVVIQAGLIAVAQVFSSYDEALATRLALTDLIDAQAETVTDDFYPLLMQLRADLVGAVPGDALEQARLISHTPDFTVPSLVLAHRLYGDLSREADLVARNTVRNPVFLRGGLALEVLSRG